MTETEKRFYSNLGQERSDAWRDNLGVVWNSSERLRTIADRLDSHINILSLSTTDEREAVKQLLGVHLPDMINSIRDASLSCAPGETKTTTYEQGQVSYSPIGESTYHAALSSAHGAISAAKDIQGPIYLSASLSLPSGHHAGPNYYHGFCYFNNAAVAANTLRKQDNRVAIIDIDAHHGDGTQNIFYQNPHVYFASLHADPDIVLPHTGRSEEQGLGSGYGTTLNLPFKIGVDSQAYKDMLSSAVFKIMEFSPQFVIISAGFDTHVREFENLPPLTLLDTEDYFDLGNIIGDINVPICVVLEGGYNTDVLADSYMAFMQGLWQRLASYRSLACHSS